ncbi:MAG TPA: hypothetical protein VMJ64_07145 [Anaerolineales bacterium]|nr:hypothetical protein [Anaerolineales bacterium]
MITIEKVADGPTGKARVRFSMPAVDCCGCLYLVGWFDEWDESVYRMQSGADGSWTLSLELEPGCEYQYCFRTADGRWLTDIEKPAAAISTVPRNSFVIGADGLPASPRRIQ